MTLQSRLLQYLQITFFLVVLLYFGKGLLIPLSFAFLISLILYPITRGLENRNWPSWLAITLSLTLLFIVVAGIGTLLFHQIGQFLKSWPKIKDQFGQALADASTWINETFGSKVLGDPEWVQSMVNQALESLLNWLPNSIYATTVNLVLFLLIPFYVALMLYYRKHLVEFVHKWTPDWSYQELMEILQDSIHTYFNFIKGVSLVYLIVGVLNSVGLLLLGIPNPFLFGFVASVLTFIPYIGITAGALLPVTVAWLTFDSVFYPLGVVAVFVFVQILEANVIFPLVVSRQIQVNALAAIVVIVMGGILWGASGMILFLPFVAIFKLIIERMEKDHPLAILLRP